MGAVKANDHLSVLTEIRLQNTDAQALALYARIRPWTDARVRHPDRPGAADLRRVRPPRVRRRQPAHRRAARVSVPDVAPAGRAAGVGRRAAEHARARLAGQLLARATRRRTTACRSSARRAGTRASRCTRRPTSSRRPARSPSARSPIRGSSDNNGGQQIAGRVALHPNAGLIVGVSASRGPFVARRRRARPGSDWRSLTQQAWGADVEYSRDYYLVRVESVYSAWRLPAIGAPIRSTGR